MPLPFTSDQFFEVFNAYNTAFWPVVSGFWIASLVLTIQLIRGGSSPRAIAAFAALQWGWTAVAYHLWSFTRINPAAWLFGAMFLAQAGGFLWLGVGRGRVTFDLRASLWRAPAAFFLISALIYPLLVRLAGHAFPAAPVFAVPCPLTLFTAGLLLAAEPPVPRWLMTVPIAWSIIGGTASLLFGMTPDLLLFPAAVLLAARAVTPLPAPAQRRDASPESR
jgi:hypothetical protein